MASLWVGEWKFVCMRVRVCALVCVIVEICECILQFYTSARIQESAPLFLCVAPPRFEIFYLCNAPQ